MHDNEEKGIVYVLTNPSMPGLVKIGQTTRESMAIRLQELYNTSVPTPFKCVYACKVKVSVCNDIENALHTAFAPQRINPNREFFQINQEQAIAILKLFQLDDAVDATAEVVEEINNDLTQDDIDAGSRLRITRRPPLNFKEMGIPVGAILQYTDDPNIQVSIADERHVIYKGEQTSLTAAIKAIRHLGANAQPTKYWTYQGKNLTDIYDETYPIEDN